MECLESGSRVVEGGLRIRVSGGKISDGGVAENGMLKKSLHLVTLCWWSGWIGNIIPTLEQHLFHY